MTFQRASKKKQAMTDAINAFETAVVNKHETLGCVPPYSDDLEEQEALDKIRNKAISDYNRAEFNLRQLMVHT